MRNFFSSLLLFLCFSASSQSFITRFEQSNGTESPVYSEIIAWWKALDAAYPTIRMMEMGPTDAGYPLHLVLVSMDRNFDIASLKRQKRNILLINNGIHPGEPDGIDASMLLVRDIVQGKYKLPANIFLAFIPVYNIGGCLNRSVNYRIDQNGPVEKGFRGNAQNLDLNRDFIKMDSKNAFTFAKIFHYLEPDVFIDNHVSNGADYQHVMTLLVSQHNKLGGAMGEFMNKTFEPGLYSLMKTKGFDLVPYVNHDENTPDKGWAEFWDSPRYSSGFGALWNTFSFMPETHMLKPYQQRVKATKALMESFIEFTGQHGKEITALREQTEKIQQQALAFPIGWKLDRARSTQITYKGFQAGFKPSEISGQARLYYDRNKPFEIQVPFYNFYKDTLSVERPVAYIIPQGWWKVIERLQANNIQLQKLPRDIAIDVQWYKIENYQASSRPFEGHHVNSSIRVSAHTKRMLFRKGDWYIPMNQPANRFLMETLEPQGEDSYFAWNFFDPILGQKEGYSDYAFEETAAEYLKRDKELKAKLDQKKASDPVFAKSGRAQLDFIYQNSPFFEPDYMRYPVYRLIK